MSANGIAHLANKELKQTGKLDLAKLKREGNTLNDDGTVASGPDATKPFYRDRNQYDIDQLPTKYNGNNLTDNANAGGLVEGRPWTT